MAIGLKFIDGDFVLENKQLVYLSGKDKTNRDFKKFLATESESIENTTKFVRYNPRYGTELNRQSLYLNLSTDAIISIMEIKLREAFDYYVVLQESRTNLTMEEIITNIDFVVYKDFVDGRKIKISIKATVASGDTVTGTFSQTIV